MEITDIDEWIDFYTGNLDGEKCPKCNAPAYTNKAKEKWCSKCPYEVGDVLSSLGMERIKNEN